jgi:hypothetical protein
MVQRENGDIALQWTINTNGKTVQISGTNIYYMFIPKMNVVMSWVKPEHVVQLLSHREKSCNCNNGTMKNAFIPASLVNVNLWSFGNREGSLLSDYREVDIQF